MNATLLAPETRRTPAPAVRTVRIALAGCGVVGGELVRLVHAHAAAIESHHGVRLEIARVLVRDEARPRAVPLERSCFTADPARFLACDADIVVEAIGGVSPAYEIARTALECGRHVVTANKALLAVHGGALSELASARGCQLEFEAAVGGGIPIVRALRRSLREAPVQRIDAILNGTTNYILTHMERGATFERALAEAQENGFAEADATRDLDGTDSADKLRLLAWLAFGAAPGEVELQQQGVLPDPDALVQAARCSGESVRLVATCERGEGGRVRGVVAPRLVARDSVFGRTLDEQNTVVVDFGWRQPITLSGPGAGGVPTASALLGDVLCC